MTWFRVDDGALEHPKWEPLESDPSLWADCVAVWSKAGTYCSANLTDGFVPRDRLLRLTPLSARRVLRAADALVDRARMPNSKFGLWERVEGGYLVHDWAERNPTRAEVEAQRTLKIFHCLTVALFEDQYPPSAEGLSTLKEERICHKALCCGCHNC